MSRGMLQVLEAMFQYGSLYWGTLTAFCLPLRRREDFRVRLALSLLPLLLLTPLYSLGFRNVSPEEQWIAAPLVFALSILLLAGLVAFCVETDWSGAVYCAVWCAISAQLISELWNVWVWFLRERFPLTEIWMRHSAARILLVILFTAGCCTGIRFTIARSMPFHKMYHVGPRQMSSALILGLMFTWMFVFLMSKNRAGEPLSTVGIEVVCQFYCLTLMYLQTELFKKSAMQKEMDTLNLLYDRQRQQYQIARQNVQIINRRCHELKVQIADLRRMGVDAAFQKSLDEAETAARLYDAGANTGNEVLDVVLTEKTLLCESRKIQLNAVADGSCLRHFEPSDLYALFANALDHAIESAVHIQQQDRRVIDLLVCVRQSFVVINVISPEREVQMGDNRTLNYEIKVIKRIVQKYKGTLTTETRSGFFAIKIIFPQET